MESHSQEDRVAVVTGAARGIGRALVDELARRRYRVVAVVRQPENVRELASEAPGLILPVQCDVTDPSTEIALREFLIAHTRRVDLLVNCAGFGATGYGIDGLSFPELDRVLAVHCHGALRCVRACLPFLRSSPRGAIVNISSRFGSVEWVARGAVPNDQATYAYRIAKAALNMLTACLAAELQDEGVRVLAVDPGKVKTRFGPHDADIEPPGAARAIFDLTQSNGETGVFLQTTGRRVPWRVVPGWSRKETSRSLSRRSRRSASRCRRWKAGRTSFAESVRAGST